MARTVRDANLQTPAARLRLAARPKPYWRTLEQGLHLGYRRSASGGAWIARRFVGEGRYAEARIGTADDLQTADGVAVRSFAQAQEATRAWWKAEVRREAGHGPAGAAYTVADAMRDYEAAFVARGGKGLASVRSIAGGYITPVLGTVECDKLTKAKVTAWFNGVVTAGRLKRAPKFAQKREAIPLDGGDAEAMRKRRSTANRVMVVLRAALNHGHREGKISSDAAWKLVKPFRAVDGVRTRFLQPAEAARLINACEGDFRALVRGALVTGCRYGELCRLKAGDVNLRAASIHIRESKSGHPRHVPLSDEGVELFTRLTMGKTAAAHVFTREGAAWKASDQARPTKAACAAASIDPPITFHGMRDTYASNLVMSGASIEVVAQLLGHGDSRITAKHYAHLAPSHVSTVLRASLPRFAAAEPSNVTTLHGADAAGTHGRG